MEPERRAAAGPRLSPSPPGWPAPASTAEEVAVDKAQPVVFRVGSLGKDYWTWVNQPEPGHPRFFGSDLLEGCSKTPWWVVPLLWLPLFTASLAWAGAELPVAHAAALVLAGVVAWQLVEYCIHRFAFHAESDSYWGITFHFLFHGCHHKYPMDRLRLVFPPVPAAAVVAAFYCMLVSSLDRSTALAVFAGMGYGYVAYDCVHYLMHHSGRLPLAPLRFLKQRHMHHHYKDHSRGYGISSVLFDVVFWTQ